MVLKCRKINKSLFNSATMCLYNINLFIKQCTHALGKPLHRINLLFNISLKKQSQCNYFIFYHHAIAENLLKVRKSNVIAIRLCSTT